jgi:hypothetical protein
MSDITVINDSEQSSLVTNGLAKNGELYLKAAGSTDAGAIVVYDSGSWRTFANEASAGFANTYSLDFDGTDDVMETGVAYATTWSASVWIKPNHTSGSNGAIFSDGSARRAYIYYDGTNYTVYLRQNGSPFNILTSSGNAIHDTWTHTAFTRDSSTNTVTMYINGSQVATATDGGAVNTVSQRPKNIGCINTSGLFPFNGKMDEFGWWDGTTLSSSDVTAIYNSGVPDDLSSYSPTNWWRMGDDDSGTGTTITDQGSGGNDGTLTNGPTFSTDIPS